MIAQVWEWLIACLRAIGQMWGWLIASLCVIGQVWEWLIANLRVIGQVVCGKWLIDGYPRVLLFDIGSAAWKLDEWKRELWESLHIGVPWHDRESNDAIILGFLTASFLGDVRTHLLTRLQ